MTRSTLCLAPDGEITCLYTELIDLRALGPLVVRRATDIRFNPASQHWEVADARTSAILHTHPSRQQCLTWETENLGPA